MTPDELIDTAANAMHVWLNHPGNLRRLVDAQKANSMPMLDRFLSMSVGQLFRSGAEDICPISLPDDSKFWNIVTATALMRSLVEKLEILDDGLPGWLPDS